MSSSAPTLFKIAALVLFLITVSAVFERNQYPNFSNDGTRIVFRYGVGAKNVLDTYAGTFTKDLIGDPPVTIRMTLTEEEILRIEAKLEEVDFMSQPGWDLIPHGSVSGMSTPFSAYYLKVSFKGVTREIRWNDSNLLPDDFKGPAAEVAKLLWSIIEAKPEYKSLPQPRGAYA
jgi:hypothetical protein